MKVMVVDDEAEIGRVLLRLLRGMDVTFCTSGPEALAALDRFRPDRVICDLNMPGMSGIEVLREMKRRSPETVCLLMTGELEVEDAPFVDGVLEKPWNGDVRAQLERVSLRAV